MASRLSSRDADHVRRANGYNLLQDASLIGAVWKFLFTDIALLSLAQIRPT